MNIKMYMAFMLVIAGYNGTSKAMEHQENQQEIQILRDHDNEFDLLNTHLTQQNYRELYAMLDTASNNRNAGIIDWAIKQAKRTLDVGLLHWVIVYKLYGASTAFSIADFESTLKLMFVALIRTKMDELVLKRLYGIETGKDTILLLKQQYTALLGGISFSSNEHHIDFKENIINKVIELFEKTINNEQQQKIERYSLFGSPYWVSHVRKPWYPYYRLVFDNLLEEEISSVFLENQELNPAITKERKVIFATIKQHVASMVTWTQFIDDCFGTLD